MRHSLLSVPMLLVLLAISATARAETNEPAETMATMDIGEETTGEAQEALTQWQKICVLGCTTLASAGCASVSASCVAGAVWSFGGILIPCVYAEIAACTGAANVIAVCGIKCTGGG